MVAILLCAVLAAWIAVLVSLRRIRELQETVNRLTSRIWTLEQREVPQREVPQREVPQHHPPVAEPPPVPVQHVAIPPPLPLDIPKPVPEPLPQSQPPRKVRTSQDWEALIGGNILNKLGALLLVVGIMSFMAYYGTHMTPAGRAACSVLVSLALLGSGVWLERRDTYRTFARGLIGAGWAALYATAYAIYALPAARIIENPYAGSFLVLLVAAGMIGHSLRYRSQAVTAVAFFSAFAALGVSPSTPLAVLAVIPLAAAVLYLAQRFNWYHMALMGVFATYGACAWRGSSDAPLLQSESLFIIYWALFEIFDILRASRRVSGWVVELIFPANAAGFLVMSYASWTARSPQTVWELSAGAALLYAFSTAWRMRSGRYQASLALAAMLTAAAIVQKLTGSWTSTALALEAEALFVAGIRLRSRFVRWLAVAGFAGSLIKIVGLAIFASQINVLGHMTYPWVLLALFHALLFYVNRAMSEPKSVIGTGFSWAASALVASALGQELPVHLIGIAWLVMAAILFELGVRRQLGEFRWQGYAIGVAGGLAIVIARPHPWTTLALAAAFAYGAAWRLALLEKSDSARREWRIAGSFVCGATAFFGALLICLRAPHEYIGAALWVLTLLLLELGRYRLPSRLRLFAYPVAVAATLAVVGLDRVAKFAGRPVWMSYLIAAAAAWIMSVRERNEARGVLAGIALFFAFGGSWIVVPDQFVPAVWAAVALAALETGNAIPAQAAAGIAALSAFFFTLPDGHDHRIIAIALLIAVHIAFRIRSIETFAPFHTVSAAILAAALIYQEVSGGMLTISWGAEALVLLGAGFAFRDRFPRLEGLALFLICVLKLFLYDLRNLDTPYRILSFIALGLILLGVSWIYTRFRAQLQKLL